ncbi:MAG: ATP-binding protein, partial [Gemmatimonadota bacterium]|nr:ATP-binding protein [Gemmatimonadota bacterium]
DSSTEPGRYLIDGDDDLLHRAVFNLLLNAIQASPADAEIQIDVFDAGPDQTGTGTTFPNGAVAISVSDAGEGIPPGMRDRLFDPFFTTKPNGSGLGLAVVHRAIDAHRGLVLLDTGATGTRFTIVLPYPSRTSAELSHASLHAPAYS